MSETSPINALPEELDPEPGDWMLIETPTQSRKLNAAWFTDPAGGGADLAAHVMDPGGAHAASAVAATPGTTLSGADVQSQLAQADAALSTSATALTDHINDPTDAHLASQVGYDPTGNTFVTGAAVQAALDAADTALIAADTALANHVNDPSAAHAATAVAFTPGVEIAATNVQAALEEAVAERQAADAALQSALTAGDTANTNALNAHINDASDAHDASAISYVPSGPVIGTDVQAAITEVANAAVSIQAHLVDAVDAHDAAAISVDATNHDLLGDVTVQGELDQVDTELGLLDDSITNTNLALTNHLNDTTDAHDASAISFVPGGSVAANNVQAAIAEVAADSAAADTVASTAMANHLSNPTDAHDASAISFVPGGSVAANNVQAAIAELATEYAAADTATAPRLLPAGGTSGQVLAKTAAGDYAVGWTTASGGGGTPPSAPNWVNTMLYGQPTNNVTGASLAFGPLRLGLIVIERAVTIAELGIYCSTLAASSGVVLAIYAEDAATGLPRTRVYMTGTLDTTTVGWKSASPAGGVALTPGRYWFGASTTSGSPSFYTAQNPVYMIGEPVSLASYGGQVVGGWTYASIFGAPPTTLTGTPAIQAGVPRVMFRPQ